MSTAIRPRPFTGLLVTLAAACIIADQLSKAWFVYTLGSHQAADFLAFCQEYFTLFAGWDPKSPGLIMEHYSMFKPDIILWDPWLRWNLVTNTGAAWSMFAGNSFALSGVSAVMATALAVIWHRYFRFHYGMTLALGAIIGGALGNFADRFRLHEVVDFIHVKLPLIGRLFPALGDPYDFPIFNVADSCAVCGTLALALYLIIADLRHMAERRRLAKVQAEAKPADGFDPFKRSDAEIAEIREIAGELSRQIRSGETFTPRSQTAMPLGLESERAAMNHSGAGADNADVDAAALAEPDAAWDGARPDASTPGDPRS
jgi:signal peptidase II